MFRLNFEDLPLPCLILCQNLSSWWAFRVSLTTHVTWTNHGVSPCARAPCGAMDFRGPCGPGQKNVPEKRKHKRNNITFMAYHPIFGMDTTSRWFHAILVRITCADWCVGKTYNWWNLHLSNKSCFLLLHEKAGWEKYVFFCPRDFWTVRDKPVVVPIMMGWRHVYRSGPGGSNALTLPWFGKLNLHVMHSSWLERLCL